MTVRQTEPSWWVSLIPIVFLVAIMSVVIRIFGADALGGASQLALILSAGVGIIIAVFVCGCSWEKLETAILDNIRNIGSGILIMAIIGMINGTWMVSGVVPTFICYGLKIISPAVFLFAVCLICAVVSLLTGSSWTTIATIGVAMVGIGNALGYSSAWTAGAIISGAYFGDKISPLSDTTVLASSSASVPLFTHIRYMLLTTVPSFVITLVIFLVVSLSHGSTEPAQAEAAMETLSSTFTISPWLLLVPAFSAFLIIRKVPALLTLLLSGLAACAAALFAQPQIVNEIAGSAADASLSFDTGLKGLMISCFGSTGIETGNPDINSLVATKGINGMMPTILLILCAAAFGGVLTGSGMIHSITTALTKRITSRTGTVAATVGSGIFSNLTTGDQYLSIILTCNLFRKLYADNGLESRLLSRSTEDSVTVTSVLIPWNSCGMTQSTVLHVATLDYLPYCFFNLISPLISILIAATGYKVFQKREAKH